MALFQCLNFFKLAKVTSCAETNNCKLKHVVKRESNVTMGVLLTGGNFNKGAK